MSRTVNRGVLLRHAKQGKLEQIGSYSYDETYGMDQQKEARPVPIRIKQQNDDWQDGYANYHEFYFQGRGGCAWKNDDGSISLIVHSNLNFTIRYKDQGK